MALSRSKNRKRSSKPAPTARTSTSSRRGRRAIARPARAAVERATVEGVAEIVARVRQPLGDGPPRNDLQQARREYERAKQVYRERIDDGQEVARHYNAIMGLNAGQNFILVKYKLIEAISPHVRAVMKGKDVILFAGAQLSKQTEAYKNLRKDLESTEKVYVEKAEKYEKELEDLEGNDREAQREIARIDRDKEKLEEERKKADDYGQQIIKWITDLFKQKEDGKVSAQAFSSKEKELKAQAAKYSATSTQLGGKITALAAQRQRHAVARLRYHDRTQAITGRRLTAIPEVQQLATRVARAMAEQQKAEDALWNQYVRAAARVHGNRPLELRRVPLPTPAQCKPHIDQIAGRVSNHVLAALRQIPARRPR